MVFAILKLGLNFHLHWVVDCEFFCDEKNWPNLLVPDCKISFILVHNS